MNEKLRKLLDKINSTKAEIVNLMDEGHVDEARVLKDTELKELQNQFDLLSDLLGDEPVNYAVPAVPAETAVAQAVIPAQGNTSVHEFAEAARRGFIVNTDPTPMSEGTPADGGYTVPEDIQTTINQYKEANFSLRQLVTVTPVSTNKGARTYQKKAQVSGFQKVEENGVIQEIAGPEFERVTYAIEDYAGFIPVTNDLLADSDANIVGVITDWIGRNSLSTDNQEILAILKGKEASGLSGLGGIKTAINVTLGQAYRPDVVIVTNDDGLDYLDQLEDLNKRPLLNPNPTEPNAIQLRVGATVVPVEVVPNNVMASEDVFTKTEDESLVTGKTYYTRSGSGTAESPYVYTPVASPSAASLSNYYEVSAYRIPFEIGDLKEAVTIFDRQQTSIMSSNVAAVTGYNAFAQRGTLFRAEVRADYKEVDSDAWVNGYIEISLGE